MQKKKIQDMKNKSSIYFISPMFKKTCNTYTAQQKFSMDFIFVLILVRIRNDFLKL